MMNTAARLGVCLLVLANCGVALASGDVSGVIQTIDIRTRQLVLDGERTYPVVRGINLAKFKPGDTVTVRTEEQNGKDLIMKITKGDHFATEPFKQQSHIPRL
jgi:hypothetical protein